MSDRALFEAAVVARMKESGFLEIEIRTECLVRCDDGYQDEVVNAGWHYWNAARAPVAELRSQKDGAYAERNKLVRLLASLFPSGIKKTAIEGWDEEWHWCVYVDLPSGQVSWHIHVSELDGFKDLKAYEGEWDGHDTDEKYRRVAAEGLNRNRAYIAWDLGTEV